MTGSRGREDRWLVETPGRLTAMADLVCFAGAGAGASVFRAWRGGLPPFAALVACQLPGRESRIDEAPAASVAEVAGEVAEAYVRSRPRPRPFVLFGHSMGGMLAFETARRLAGTDRAPAGLVLSASAPPEPGREAEMDRAELEQLLLAYDPENVAVVGDAELAGSLLPVLEADIGMLRRHRPDPGGAALEAPAWLLSGGGDRVVPRRAVARWQGHFSGRVTVRELPGGHHFPFRESRDAVLQCLAGVLGEAAGRRGG